MEKEKCSAIVLAAGSGKRMNSDIKKQYLDLADKPLIYYALAAFEHSQVDEVVLVTAAQDLEYCRKDIVDRYHFKKVIKIVPGGKERYHSVYEGLKSLEDCSYVLIHDGARPFITSKIIKDTIDGAKQYTACVVGMPVKDTIKIVDENQNAVQTPARDYLWMVQTPQAFSYQLIYKAYHSLMGQSEVHKAVTDDAMVVETMTKQPVKLIAGSYTNIKITTPEDIVIAEALLKNKGFEK